MGEGMVEGPEGLAGRLDLLFLALEALVERPGMVWGNGLGRGNGLGQGNGLVESSSQGTMMGRLARRLAAMKERPVWARPNIRS